MRLHWLGIAVALGIIANCSDKNEQSSLYKVVPSPANLICLALNINSDTDLHKRIVTIDAKSLIPLTEWGFEWNAHSHLVRCLDANHFVMANMPKETSHIYALDTKHETLRTIGAIWSLFPYDNKQRFAASELVNHGWLLMFYDHGTSTIIDTGITPATPVICMPQLSMLAYNTEIGPRESRPDGTRIAQLDPNSVILDGSKSELLLVRHDDYLEVMDVKTTTTVLKEYYPSQNCFDAKISPTGKVIAIMQTQGRLDIISILSRTHATVKLDDATMRYITFVSDEELIAISKRNLHLLALKGTSWQTTARRRI